MPDPTASTTASPILSRQHIGPSAKIKAFVPENVGNSQGPPRRPSTTSLDSFLSGLGALTDPGGDGVGRATHHAPPARSNPLDSAPRPAGSCAARVLTRRASITSLDSFLSGLGARTDPGGDGVHRAAYHPPLARSNPLDSAPRPAGPCAAHVLAVDTALAPLQNEWSGLDARVTAARATKGGPLQVSDLYDAQQVRTALSPREAHTRAVLGDLGMSADIRGVLGAERCAGGRAIMDACRLLSMPEVREREPVKAALEQALRSYITRADGDYAGTYVALGHHANDECEALIDCIKDSVGKIGLQQVRDRLLKDMAPAILDTMARKNPGICAGELRGKLAELLNVQAFSGYKALLDGATGPQLLHVVELLPNFVESAEKPTRPPANDRDAAPPTAVRPVADPIADVARILKALQGVLPPITVGNIGNNNGKNNGNNNGNKHPVPGTNSGNAKSGGPTLPLRSEPDFERLASRDEQYIDRPVVHAERSTTARLPLVDEEHAGQATTGEDSSPPPPPPPPSDPVMPTARNGMLHIPKGLSRKNLDGLQVELRQKHDVRGFGLKKTPAPAARVEQDRAAQRDVVFNSDDDTYRNGNVPIVKYDSTKTQYLATTNQYMKAPIRPGATPDSTFLFPGESRRNNVAGAEPNAVAPGAEDADPASPGAGTATTLRQVNVAWDAKPVRDRFGGTGVPTPMPIPDHVASTSQ